MTFDAHTPQKQIHFTGMSLTQTLIRILNLARIRLRQLLETSKNFRQPVYTSSPLTGLYSRFENQAWMV